MSGWDQRYDLEEYGHLPRQEPKPLFRGLLNGVATAYRRFRRLWRTD